MGESRRKIVRIVREAVKFKSLMLNNVLNDEYGLIHMCGICGIVGFEDKNLLERMCESVSHRGPDDSGIYTDKGIGLAHRRLSVVDLEGGHQPMHNEDESVWLVCNGEIYNFKNLKQQLEKKGHRFYTASDTEVLLHLYEEEGMKFLNQLEGMFAFAIWDANLDRLFLARDRFGIKPLYYTKLGEKFLFGSEIKSILQFEEIRKEVDVQSLYNFLHLNSVPGERTLFKDIKELLPSSILTFDDGKISIEKYWFFSASNKVHASEDYCVDQLISLLRRSVRKRMMSDVPVGTLMGGGIDSSTVTALMCEISEEPIKTYAVGFEEPNELPFARIVAEHLGTDHHELTLDPSNICEYTPVTIWHQEIPHANLEPTYLISKTAKEKITVTHNGLGSDELLCGYKFHKETYENERYDKYFSERMKKKIIGPILKVLPQANVIYYLRQILQQRFGDKVDGYILRKRGYGREREKEIFTSKVMDKVVGMDEVLKPYFQGLEGFKFIDQMLIVEIRTKLADDYLAIADRQSMAHGLEVRVPFLDSDVVNFCFSIPYKLRMKNGIPKYLLRKAMADILPKETIWRGKKGFGFDSLNWYERGIGDFIRLYLQREIMKERGFFDFKWVENLLGKRPNKKNMWKYEILWRIALFEIWYKIFIEGDVRRPRLRSVGLV